MKVNASMWLKMVHEHLDNSVPYDYTLIVMLGLESGLIIKMLCLKSW